LSQGAASERDPPEARPSDAAPCGRLQPGERMAILDVLRGFSLLGVLVANMAIGFTGLVLLPRAEVSAMASGIDGIALVVIEALFRRKSLTLLSFLFGLGFALQIERAEARGKPVVPTYLRRLGALFVIGAVHAVLLWWGDQLTIYAIAGVLLLLFRRASVRSLLIWAALLILVPRLLAAVPAISRLLDPFDPAKADAFTARVLAALRGHDPADTFRMQALQTVHSQGSLAAWQYLYNVGRFLLGYAAGRSRLFHGGEERLPFFRRLLFWGIGISAVCTPISVASRVLLRRGVTIPLAVKLALVVPEEVGIIASTAVYLAALVLLMQRPAWERRLMVLAPVGQTALTCYLTQSLICAFLFYGWGLGLMDRVGLALCLPFSAAVFAAQIIASRLWLTRFRFGPFEWVWRTLTYGRQPVLRRE